MTDLRRFTNSSAFVTGAGIGRAVATALAAGGAHVVAVLLLLSVSACSAPRESTERPAETGAPSAAPSPPPSTPAAPEAPVPPPDDAAGPVPVSLQFGDVVITATVEDTAAGRSLLAQLPTELDFRDYGGQEKIATLPAPLDLDGAPDRAAAPAGTLGYYAPDQGLVLYYDDVGSYPGIVPLGTVSDVEALRESEEGPVVVSRG